MRRTSLLTALVVASLVACSSGAANTSDEPAVIYSAVIRAVLADTSHPLKISTDTSVFVAPTDERSPITLEVQADIVDELHQLATLRFVDQHLEAIDDSTATKTVDDQGVLITIGKIPNGNTITVKADRYLDATDTLNYRVTLTRTHTQWKTTAITSQP